MDIIKAEVKHFDSIYSLICELENEQVDKEALFQIYLKNIETSDIFLLFSHSR